MRQLGKFLIAVLAVIVGMFLYGAICDFIAGEPCLQEIVYPQN